jgi:hypothetical protein
VAPRQGRAQQGGCLFAVTCLWVVSYGHSVSTQEIFSRVALATMSSLGSNKLLWLSMLCVVWCYLCFWHCVKVLRGHLNRHGKLVHIYVVNGFKHVVVGDGAMCPCMFLCYACFGAVSLRLSDV